MNTTQISFELETLYQNGFFSDLDYYFSKTLAHIFNEHHPLVLTSLAHVSRSLSEGHVCLDIKNLEGNCRHLSDDGQIFFEYPHRDEWINALKTSAAVSEDIHTPLVLDPYQKLYLARYFDFQARLIKTIGCRLSYPGLIPDEPVIDEILSQFFPSDDVNCLTQKTAIKNALVFPFTILSGGPGTGKTFVIGLLGKVLSMYAKKKGQAQKSILCLAPTGKAASKLESGSTIHAALKPFTDRTGFKHNADNPLDADFVIVDEASMIDMPLFVRLMEAIPLTSGILFTGDRHQLTSIQAGSVFSDLCSARLLSTHMVNLDYNFRSRGQTGIEKLSKAINEKDASGFETLLLSGGYPDLLFQSLNKPNSLDALLKYHVPLEYHDFADSRTPEQALSSLERFRILCAHNEGPFGTLQVNHVCEKILRSLHNSGIEKKSFLKPVMVTVNDYRKGLFNGDTGALFEEQGDIAVFFKSPENKVRSYRYLDLPPHDTAFAMSVHKSQGSEFDTVLMIIPDRFSPVVTRQLLYTGVTRARKKVILLGDLEMLKTAISMDIKRHSGVAEHLENKLREKKY